MNNTVSRVIKIIKTLRPMICCDIHLMYTNDLLMTLMTKALIDDKSEIYCQLKSNNYH